LTLDEDQDDGKIAKRVSFGPPISGQFSPVADTWTRDNAPVPEPGTASLAGHGEFAFGSVRKV
ncbi:hypothetical protein ACFWJ4_41555, partial [Kitasatospora sp. NPDC127067]|uniref:hypothetical protein n=1 Tax=Kitasatospora sp. NPDC127067 TaxID=3347126 RepID=UPI00364C2638